MKKSIKLLTKEQAKPLIKPFLELVAEQLSAGKAGWLQWQQQTRSLEQSALFHAQCADVARQAKWLGKTLTPEQWKVLFISGHAMATKQGAEIVPGLEGEFVNIRESSASMTVERMTSLIEYVFAWGAQNDMKFRATE